MTEEPCDHDWKLIFDDDGDEIRQNTWQYFECQKCGEMKECKSVDLHDYYDLENS